MTARTPSRVSAIRPPPGPRTAEDEPELRQQYARAHEASPRPGLIARMDFAPGPLLSNRCVAGPGSDRIDGQALGFVRQTEAWPGSDLPTE